MDEGEAVDLGWPENGLALTPDDGEGHAAEAGAGPWKAWAGGKWVEVPGLRVRRA